MRLATTALFLTLALPPVPPAAADPAPIAARQDAFAEAKTAAVAELVEGLVDVAKWCKKNRVFLESHKIYQTVLVYDSEQKDARKELGWKWSKKEEEWYRPREYKAPRDFKPENLLEAIDRKKAVFKAYRDRIIAALDEHAVPAVPRQREYDELIALDPDDTELRELLGYVEGWEGREWVLPESKTSKESAERIEELAKKVLSEKPVATAVEREEWEVKLGVPWTHAYETPRVRVVTTMSESEAKDTAETVHVMQEFLQGTIGGNGTIRRDYKIYIIEGENEIKTFANNYPGLPEADKEYFPTVASAWVPKTHVLGMWDDGGAISRLNGIARQTMGAYLRDTYGITMKTGWAWEGFSIYLTYKLIGTRFGFFMRQTEYDADGKVIDVEAKLEAANSNWLKEAHEVFTSKNPPNFPRTLGKDVNNLTMREFLQAYALAVYLMEARNEIAPKVLKRVGAKETPVKVLEEELGMTLPELEQRLIAWLSDYKDIGDKRPKRDLTR